MVPRSTRRYVRPLFNVQERASYLSGRDSGLSHRSGHKSYYEPTPCYYVVKRRGEKKTHQEPEPFFHLEFT